MAIFPSKLKKYRRSQYATDRHAASFEWSPGPYGLRHSNLPVSIYSLITFNTKASGTDPTPKVTLSCTISLNCT